MNNTDRLVITIDPTLKKKFLASAKDKGQTASYLVRKFLTDFTSKGTSSGKKRGRPAKTVTQ